MTTTVMTVLPGSPAADAYHWRCDLNLPVLFPPVDRVEKRIERFN